jgi:hypothetical protein
MKAEIEARIAWLSKILDRHKKKPFLSHNGVIIETVIFELKQIKQKQ